MIENDKGQVLISSQNDLDDLLSRIKSGRQFGKQFKFGDRDYLVSLLEGLGIDYDKFEENYFYYDSRRKMHISESQFDYVWISTHGLIAKKKATTNKAVNACINQYTVISLLLEKSIEVSQSDTVYDVDSYNFGLLSELSPAIFHNMLFYIEVLCKAYLSLNDAPVPHTHKLSLIYRRTVEIMKAKNHNDSLFQIQILDPLYKFIDHVNSLPADFKEQFVKYDDNSNDDTVIIFDSFELQSVLAILEISNDFIVDYYHMGTETFYLKTGVYQRMLNRCKTDEQRQRVEAMYGHLVVDDDA